MKSQRTHRGQSQDSSPHSTRAPSQNHTGKKSEVLREEGVKVFVRIKPEKGKNQIITQHSNEEMGIQSVTSMEDRSFRFDQVFPQATQTKTIFEQTCQPLLQNVLYNHTNGCIMVYGQTGSGKTFTMGMLKEINELEQGIVPMSLSYLFNQINALHQKNSYTIELSFLQIYLEELDDLLNPEASTKRSLSLRRNEDQDPYIKGLVNVEVSDYREAIQIVNAGLRYRYTGQQSLNQNSSRSHTILTIYVNRVIEDAFTGELICSQSKVQLVDLAGSERTKKTQSKGMRMEEAKHINQSLAALGNVVSALANHNMKFIPFRDSKLTQVLQCSLQGAAQVVLIGTISPSSDSAAESLSTLLFAQRCKQIKLRPQQVPDQSRNSSTEQFYQEEIKRIIGVFEQRQRQQDEQISHLERLLTTQNLSPLKVEDASEQQELATYLVKLLRKINQVIISNQQQHTSKLMIENKQHNEQLNKSTLEHLTQSLMSHNLNSNCFDRAHNIMSVTGIIQNLDERFPTTMQLSELIQPQDSSSLSAMVSHIQRVSQSLLSQINQLAKIARTSERLKQELTLHHFLQQQRDIELDNWMRTVGYLYSLVVDAPAQQNSIRQARQLQEKILSMINQGDFYQEMDTIKQRILQFTHSSSRDTFTVTLESLRRHTNNFVFDQRFQDSHHSVKPANSQLQSVFEQEGRKAPVPSPQTTSIEFDSVHVNTQDLIKQRKADKPQVDSSQYNATRPLLTGNAHLLSMLDAKLQHQKSEQDDSVNLRLSSTRTQNFESFL